LFGGKSGDSPQEVADRLERFADRSAHAGDLVGERAARDAAQDARLAPDGAEARLIERAFLRSQGLGPDGRPLRPVLGERGADGPRFVGYGRTVRAGGSRGWRYNNPGYVRCTDRSSSYGAISCDGEFAIFPDYATGVSALRQTLRDEHPGKPVREALREQLPPEAGDPSRILDEAGLDPAAPTDALTEADCEAMGRAFQGQPAWTAGDEYDRGSESGPEWVSEEFGEAAESPADDGTPSDNS
jgi:hypothetical protein